MFLRVLCPRLYSAPLLQKPKQQSSQLSDVRFPGTVDHNLSIQGRLTHLPRGSGYRVELTETHSKPCIWNLFLCSDTLHFICIFTYSELRAGFLSIRDRGNTGHSQSWCVFISYQRVFDIAFWKPNKKRQQSVPHKAPESRQTPAVRFAYLGMNLTYIKEIQSQQKGW